jgi:hypothetical protein
MAVLSLCIIENLFSKLKVENRFKFDFYLSLKKSNLNPFLFILFCAIA